ncbi:MAG TPA: zinc ribbon domain-containing protein [Spirochaetota bacterium]|nr:zinc ribbon domain-containing protein [Spirochaetota bacterium]HRZ28976.1 zinc ribbon domain-containing protein [Spirochaetota bacterium]HSA15817.1 zinc ribbon domain-containing protein [Spirochaetota bacterium]
MPLYEFKCASCGRDFSEIRKAGDYNSVACPECGSTETQKRVSMFSGGKATDCTPSGGG